MLSGQVSQMFAQQNQMFQGNAQYSQQISQQMPGMYSGMFGMPMAGPQGFGYGGSQPMGADIGARASGGIVSGMGGAAQFALGAGTLMAGMGMGGPSRFALDPFAGAGAMYRAGGAMGMGMGGRLAMGAVGMLPAAGVLAGAGHAISSVMGGAQEQAQIERSLGQNFNFSNASSGGRGFSKQQGKAIGDMVRQLDGLPDMMSSVSELTRIMDKMGQMGVMNGVTNVKDFGSKFKSTLGVLKEMSKVIGSTMEEALPLFGEIRRSGMYSSADILKNAMQRKIVGGMTGMNQQQVGQTAAFGAQMGHATGGSRATGASHALRMAGQLGMANQMGALDNDKIMELTGMEGAEGIQALSGQLTQAGYRMSGGALGTAMSIAMAEQKDGKFTGKMDKGLMDRFRRGDISKSQMLGMVHKKTGSRGSKMSYVSKRGELRSEMAGEMGVEGQMNMLGMVLGERGYDNPDALNIVSQGFGLDEKEAGLLVELGKKMPDINLEMKQRGRSESKKIAQEAFMKENYSWDAVKTKVGKKIEGVITEPFKKFGAELRNSINQAVDDFVDDVTGKYKVEVTAGMSNLLRGAGSGLGDSRSRLASMLGGSSGKMAAGALGSGVNMSDGGMSAAANWLTGNQTSGQKSIDAMNMTVAGKGGLQTRINDFGGGLTSAGYNTLDSDRSFLTGTTTHTMATDAGMRAGADRLSALASGKVGMGDSVLSSIAGEKDFTAARAEMLYKEAFGKNMGGGAIARLSEKYASGDVTAAIAGAGGAGSSLLEGARGRLGGAASMLNMTPDRQAALSARIKGFERGASDIFGSDKDAQEFTSTAKELQGTGAGDFLMKTYQRRFKGEGGQTELGARAEALGGIATAGIGGQGGEAVGKKLMGYGLSWMGAPDEMKTALTAKNDNRDEYFKRLAVSEMAGGKISAADQTAINQNRESYESVKDEIQLRNISQKGKGENPSWSKDEKDFLRKMGFSDPAKFTPAMAEKFGKFGELMNKAKLDPKARGEMKDYMDALGAQGIVEAAQRYQEHGKSVGGAVKALRGSGFKMGKDGEAMLGRVEAYAGRLTGMTDVAGVQKAFGIGGGTSATEDMGGMAYDLTDKKYDKDRDAILATDDDLSAAYSRAQHVKQRLKKNKTFDTFFDKGSFSKLGVAEQERLGSIREQYFDSSGKVKDEKSLTKFMAGEEGQKFLTAAGAESRSKYADQAAIAKNMEAFGASTAQLAQIIADMKKEKKP